MGPADELWPDRHELDEDELRDQPSHDKFMFASVELFKELGIITTLIASSSERDDRGFERNDAIRRGLIVRVAKIANSLLAETVADHGEQQFALTRQLLETGANFLYLLAGDADRYNAFVADSLIAERDLGRLIQANIKARGGSALPIEERMLRSIESTAKGASMDLDSLPPRGKSGWPNAFERLRQVGLRDLYVLFRMGSVAVHGGWSDLYLHHLEDQGDGRFLPHDMTPARPEPLTSMGILIIVVLTEYLAAEPAALRETFQPRVDDLRSRIQRLDEAHEAFVQRDC